MRLPWWFTAFVLFLPAAAILRWLHAPAPWVFVCAALAIAPLAGWMGRATEELAERFGPGIGGLLNATFGNAAEFIVSLLALRRGLTALVKASLVGSIIGNLLLVTGLSLIAGGLRYERQAFNRKTAGLGSTLMALAVAGMLVPAMFHSLVGTPAIEKDLSLGISALLFLVYGLNLGFSLFGHREMPRETPHRGSHVPNAARAFAILAIATLGVTGASELLVGAVEAAAKAWGMTTLFIGVIVVAAVGNAAENSTAVLMALKNKLDVSMAIATGSSLQIALLIAPVLVFLGALFHKPMDLRFTPFETLAMALAVGVGHLAIGDGESNWLEGALLVALYIMLAVAFFFIPENAHADELNLSSGRPLQMEDAWPTEKGDAQFQGGAGYQTQRQAKDQVFFPLQLNVGVTSSADVEFQSALYSAPRSVAQTPHAGDLQAGGQWKLCDEGRGWPTFGVKAMLTLPTGAASSGLGGTLKALVTKHIGETIVNVNETLDLLSGLSREDWPQRWTTILGMERPLAGARDHRWAALADLYHQRGLARDDADTVGIEVGLMKGLGKDLSADAGAGTEVLGPEDRHRFILNAGFSWSFAKSG